MKLCVAFLAAFLLHVLVLSLPLAILTIAGRQTAWPILLIALLGVAAATETVLVEGRRVREQIDLNTTQTRLEVAGCVALLIAFWLCIGQGTWAIRGQSIGPGAWAGTALITAGIALRGLAIAVLGECFGRSDMPHQPVTLVTAGLYGVLRHPSETGLVLLVLGGVAFSESLAALMWYALVVLPITWLRLRAEEGELLVRFGESYRDYRAAVGAVLPRLV